jgi:hypothetical protein
MCGTLLEPRPAEVATGQVSVADRLRALTEDEAPKPPRNNSGSAEPRRAAVPSFLGLDDAAPRRPASSSGISGPSFLGLDAPPERSNYLLEDEEPRSHWRGYLVALLIVVIAVLVALQWRAEVRIQVQKVGAMLWARMHATPAQPNVNEKIASGTPPDTTPPAQPQTTTEPPATNTAVAPAPSQPNASSTPAPPANESANAANPPSSAIPAGKPVTNAPDQQAPASPAKATEGAGAANARKPAAGADQQADALLLTAQKYLHGLGVPRDCDQGLVYLKEAVRQPSAPARSQMGALYATGTCVPQNRVEAYRWFSSAIEVEPNNPWLGRERDSLYGEMTAAERQQLNR